jgi:uncharacterized membrane protein YvbJ
MGRWIGHVHSDCLSKGKDVLTLNCKSCGTGFPEGTQFCSICGEAFTDSQSSAAKSEVSSPATADSSSKAPSPIVLIGLAIGVALIFYVLLKG